MMVWCTFCKWHKTCLHRIDNQWFTQKYCCYIVYHIYGGEGRGIFHKGGRGGGSLYHWLKLWTQRSIVNFGKWTPGFNGSIFNLTPNAVLHACLSQRDIQDYITASVNIYTSYIVLVHHSTWMSFLYSVVQK